VAGSSYGELVRRHRVAAGLTQEELAARSGLGVRTVSDIERGRIGRPHRSTVDLIARTLDRDDLAYDAIRASLLTKARTPGAAERTPDRDDHPGAPGLRPVLDIFPVAIGHYSDAELASLDVGTRVGRLVDMLAPFGGQHRPWRHPARDRGADAVQRRLREWVSPLLAEPSGQVDQQANPSAGSTVLYWAGHGWSDGTRAA